MKILTRKFGRKAQTAPTTGKSADNGKIKTNESGFSLVEVICALVILLIALLGVFVTFTYSINYNAGNSSRSQALAILQQEIEQMRSKKFTHDFTDPALFGGVKNSRTVTAANGNKFKISVTIDNNPQTTAVEADETVNPTIKQITLSVMLDNPTPGWQTATPATVILQRVRGN